MGANLWVDYLRWLTKEVNFNDKRWFKVLLYLHNTPFTWCENVPRDENRALDGTFERVYFFRDMGLKDGDFDKDCSVLEMLVGFVKRVSEEYVNIYDGNENMQGIILEAFLQNLGLTPDICIEIADEYVKNWLNREYDDDGLGSIMPLLDYENGYKNMEIWSQWNVFLDEYNIKDWSDFERFV